MRMKCFIDI